MIFVERSTEHASMAQGIFKSGSERRAIAQTRQAFPKMSQVPSAFSFKKRVPRVSGDKPSLSKES